MSRHLWLALTHKLQFGPRPQATAAQLYRGVDKTFEGKTSSNKYWTAQREPRARMEANNSRIAHNGSVQLDNRVQYAPLLQLASPGFSVHFGA